MKSSSRSQGAMTKVERKTVEKNRRIQMKSLFMRLASLIPREYAASPKGSGKIIAVQDWKKKRSDDADVQKQPPEMLSQQDHLEQATSYIKTLHEKIERMKKHGRITPKTARSAAHGSSKGTDRRGLTTAEFRPPVVEVRHRDSNLEVVLVSGLEKRFLFREVIGVLEEEGAEVVSANFSVVGEKIFHTIHSQAVSSRLGLDSSRVTERLKQLIRS